MARARLTIATSFALALLWVGAAGAAAPAAQSAGSSPSLVTVAGLFADDSARASGAGAKVSGLTANQRKARKRALKKCKKIRRKPRRKSCVKRVRKNYRAKARAGKRDKGPVVPAPPTAIHDVTVFDHVFSPDRIEIKKGEAIRFVWDGNNKDAHSITLREGPAGVGLRDFEQAGAPSQGAVFQRTFTIPGNYRIGCSLHHLQLIDVTVTP